jgi:hypothetical protein
MRCQVRSYLMSKFDNTTTETKEYKISFQRMEYVDMLINIETD